MRPLRILTWHQHGSYLLYLVQSRHQFFLPVKPGRPHPYGGRVGPFAWPDNVHEIPADEVKNANFDLILFQWKTQWLVDQYALLSPEQQRLPRIFLEHDTPQEHPTNTRHVVDDPNVLLVHVTPFNDLMWDSGRTPTFVVEHGVMVPEGLAYTGELDRAIAIVNHLKRRGRRLGVDVFERARREVPIDLVGMGAEEMEGVGEVQHNELAAFEVRYRLFFNPIRYTSLGLAVLEAMMLGMPIVGLATTEMATVIENGVSGYVDTNVDNAVDAMRHLLADPGEARRLGEGARRKALERFNIQRFADDWDRAFVLATGHPTPRRLATPTPDLGMERASGAEPGPSESQTGPPTRAIDEAETGGLHAQSRGANATERVTV